MRHIRDWLVGAVIRHDPWLDRLNPDGVPLKLAKFGRFEQIVDEIEYTMECPRCGRSKRIESMHVSRELAEV